LIDLAMLVLSGMPGSGKSHYAAHLADQGWRWINHDVASGGDALERLWLAVRTDSLTETLAAFVAAAPTHTVLEFGFPVQYLPVIEALRKAGAVTWWISGDDAACLRAWRGERKVDDAIWDNQVDDIAREWPRIAVAYGDHIIITRLHGRPSTTDEIDAVIKALHSPVTGPGRIG
jgi:hypothetical protein